VFRGPAHNCLHTDIPRLREGSGRRSVVYNIV
jgi:hypothetical protein